MHLLVHCKQNPIDILGGAIRGCMSPEKKTGKSKTICGSFVAPKNGKRENNRRLLRRAFKFSYICFASEGATRRFCIWTILKGWWDDLFFSRFWRNYVSILGFNDPEVVTRPPLFRLFCRNYEMILGFDYFRGASEWSWVLRILKESKTKLFCLWEISADFLTQSPLGKSRYEISGQRTPSTPAVKILNFETPCLSWKRLGTGWCTR